MWRPLKKISVWLVKKVKKLWEGQKIWKKTPLNFDVNSVMSKQVGIFFSVFCGLFIKPYVWLRETRVNT